MAGRARVPGPGHRDHRAPADTHGCHRGLPGWAATTLLVLVVYGVLVVLAGVVVVSLARLATLLPSYAPQFNELLASATAKLAGFGVGAAQLREIAGTLNYGRLVGLVSGLLLGVTSLLGNLGLPALAAAVPQHRGVRGRHPTCADRARPGADRRGADRVHPPDPPLHGGQHGLRPGHRAGRLGDAGPAGCPARAAVGPAGVHHQLHPLHRVLARPRSLRCCSRC